MSNSMKIHLVEAEFFLKTEECCVRFEVLNAMAVNIPVLREVTVGSVADTYRGSARLYDVTCRRQYS
jgi:vacuolar-type H+-ATPase subunit D/Vma8